MLTFHQQIEIEYPTCTLVNAKLDYRPRKLVVKKVRDLVVEPLTPEITCGGRSITEGACSFWPGISRPANSDSSTGVP